MRTFKRNRNERHKIQSVIAFIYLQFLHHLIYDHNIKFNRCHKSIQREIHISINHRMTSVTQSINVQFLETCFNTNFIPFNAVCAANKMFATMDDIFEKLAITIAICFDAIFVCNFILLLTPKLSNHYI